LLPRLNRARHGKFLDSDGGAFTFKDMTEKINDKIDAVANCRARVLEIELLRQELTELLDDVFPPCEDHDYLDEAMAFHYLDLEVGFYVEVEEYAYHVEYGYRCRKEFFKDHLPCPWHLASKSNDSEEG